MFRSVNTLPQQAGVPLSQMRRLVLKELVDNALDAKAGAKVDVWRTPDATYVVKDNGPGISDDPAEIARLCSIKRSLLSSKLNRMPTRGALGNGLRVVTGAVLASKGTLQVATRNRLFTLTPHDDGSTSVTHRDVDFPVGTQIQLRFGSSLPADPKDMEWARQAIAISKDAGDGYKGKPSPWWFDGDHFWEFMQSHGARPVRDVISTLDGCTGPKAGAIARAFKNRTCVSLSREEAVYLLRAARELADEVNPRRLGEVGPKPGLPEYRAVGIGRFWTGGVEPKALIPFLVEVWAGVSRSDDDDDDYGLGDRAKFTLNVNRSPVIGQFTFRTQKNKDTKKNELGLYGNGLNEAIEISPGIAKANIDVTVNIATPFCPIVSSGKSPYLNIFGDQIATAIKIAVRKAYKALPKPPTETEKIYQKDVVLRRLDECVAIASSDGTHRFNQRQLYYIIRPLVMEEVKAELTWGNFTKIITGYEAECGEIEGMIRDSRGLIYHPHTGETIPLGTISVEEYQRPDWTFNKVLLIEKEGFFEALKDAKWPERHDCAIMTAKGFTTRAARDLIDQLGQHDEPVQIFCIHDADASGTMIYQTLVGATLARPGRTIEVVNLGLEAWEGVEMGLPVENVKEKDYEQAVADYVMEREDGDDWVAWYKTKRIELNAMTTERLIEWLDDKMEEHSENGKLVPPSGVIENYVERQLESCVRHRITERILREARIDERVQEALGKFDPVDGDLIAAETQEWLEKYPTGLWSDYAASVAFDMAREVEE